MSCRRRKLWSAKMAASARRHHTNNVTQTGEVKAVLSSSPPCSSSSTSSSLLSTSPSSALLSNTKRRPSERGTKLSVMDMLKLKRAKRESESKKQPKQQEQNQEQNDQPQQKLHHVEEEIQDNDPSLMESFCSKKSGLSKGLDEDGDGSVAFQNPINETKVTAEKGSSDFNDQGEKNGQEGENTEDLQEFDYFKLERCKLATVVWTSGLPPSAESASSLYLVFSGNQRQQPTATDALAKTSSSASTARKFMLNEVPISLVRFNLTGQQQSYDVVGNIDRVFAKFRHEGRATIRLLSPKLDIIITHAPSQPLASFLDTLYKIHTDPYSVHLPNKITISSSVTTSSMAQLHATKMSLYSHNPIPRTFPQQLKSLHIDSHFMFKLPSSITALSNLHTLHCCSCSLKTLPDLSTMEQLSSVKFDNNSIHKISMSHLPPSLRSLSLANNNSRPPPPPSIFLYFFPYCQRIEEMGSGIGTLSQLSQLDLSNNKLRSLPSTFWLLKHLRILKLAGNNIVCLPVNFNVKLDVLDVFGNPFSTPYTLVTRIMEIADEYESRMLSLEEMSIRHMLKHSLESSVIASDVPLITRKFRDSTRCSCCGNRFCARGIEVIKRKEISKLALSSVLPSGMALLLPCVASYCGPQCTRQSSPYC
eukprot:m.24805 g.24805  ORF g.24805 m.24805 type:complete len:647 (-) comp5698_c0_seq4:87-2027(-)